MNAFSIFSSENIATQAYLIGYVLLLNVPFYEKSMHRQMLNKYLCLSTNLESNYDQSLFIIAADDEWETFCLYLN